MRFVLCSLLLSGCFSGEQWLRSDRRFAIGTVTGRGHEKIKENLLLFEDKWSKNVLNVSYVVEDKGVSLLHTAFSDHYLTKVRVEMIVSIGEMREKNVVSVPVESYQLIETDSYFINTIVQEIMKSAEKLYVRLQKDNEKVHLDN